VRVWFVWVRKFNIAGLPKVQGNSFTKFAGDTFLESPENTKTENNKGVLFSPKRLGFEANCIKTR
jgi:hypothetical protein